MGAGTLEVGVQEDTSAIAPSPKATLRDKYENSMNRLNAAVTSSRVGAYFQLEERNSTFTQEIRAGTVAFLTICYILAVNSAILSETGGTCTIQDCTTPGPGCMFNPTDEGWANCLGRLRSSLISATAIAAMISCFFMGVLANMPLALAPGMGINAYFTYTVVGFYGNGPLTYQGALACVFVEGWIFIAISATGLRQKLVALVPRYIMFATASGIGMFLAFIGLQASEGLGVVASDGATLVTLGGCPLANRQYAYYMSETVAFTDVCNATSMTLLLPPVSSGYSCDGNVMRSPTMWLGISGAVVMVVLMARGVPAAILFGVLWVTFISWIPNTAATYFGPDSQVAGGVARFAFFKKVVAVPDVSMTAGKLDFSSLGKGDTWPILITFLYLDFLDATSTMMTMARLMGQTVPGFINDRGVWPKQMQTMVMDGASIVLGSVLGSSPLTVMAESAVGVREGGRTGITAIMIAFGFGISMFLAPIFGNIPGYATGPALILVGALMMEHARDIEWNSVRVAVPSFLTMIMMPLTYTISYGVLIGLFAAISLWLSISFLDFANVVLGRGSKTYRIVWLEMWCNMYLAVGNEDRLIEELPGYIPSTIANACHGAESEGSAGDASALVVSLQKALAAAEIQAAKQLAERDAQAMVDLKAADPLQSTFNRKSV